MISDKTRGWSVIILPFSSTPGSCGWVSLIACHRVLLLAVPSAITFICHWSFLLALKSRFNAASLMDRCLPEFWGIGKSGDGGMSPSLACQ